MRRLFLTWLLSAAALARAAEVAPPTTRDNRPADDSPSPRLDLDAGSTKAKRQVSPDTAAKLSTAAQKLVPPKIVETPEPAPEVSPVVRETAKPRNQIVRLPRFIVEEPRPHIPTSEFQVLTPRGRIEYAFNRWPGLRFGPLAWLNRTIALQMLEDELLAQRRREEAELWSVYLVREP